MAKSGLHRTRQKRRHRLLLAEDEELELILLLLRSRERSAKTKEDTMDWDKHVQKRLCKKEFENWYRMSLRAFNKLVDLLRPAITCDEMKAKNSIGGVITPEIVVAIGLRWLSGAMYQELQLYGASRASVYRVRDIFIDAVLSCPALDIKFPTSGEELEAVRKEFMLKSTDGVMRGCVGAMDGLLAFIDCPSAKDCNGNQRAYYSGHYQHHGLNVQAICDAHLRFLFFAVAGPGRTSDLVAYEGLSIREVIENLPEFQYIVADAAYMLTEHVLVSFTGQARLAPDKDSFNYFLSQLRIRIEMAFGRFTTKWRVIANPLHTNLQNSSKILQACARLHNFVIDEDGENQAADVEDGNSDHDFEDDLDETNEDSDDETCMDEAATSTAATAVTVVEGSPLGLGYHPTIEAYRPIPGTSRNRDSIVAFVHKNKLRRPAKNIERRRQELYELESPLM